MLKKYLLAKNLVFVGLLSILAAQIANRFIVGQIKGPHVPGASILAQSTGARKSPARKSIESYQAISDKNIFNSDYAPQKGKPSSRNPSDAPLKKAELSVELIGTVVGTPEVSFAIVEDTKTKEQEVYQVDDIIQDTARLLSISRCRVVVARDGAEEILECSQEEDARNARGRTAAYRPSSSEGKQEVKKVSESEYLIDESEVQNALDNMNVLMTQIRVVPNFQDGQTNGFRVFAIKPNSIFDKIGLKNGDVIQRINDRDITTPDKAFQVFNDLRSEKSLSVEIIRRGQKSNLRYEIR